MRTQMQRTYTHKHTPKAPKRVTLTYDGLSE